MEMIAFAISLLSLVLALATVAVAYGFKAVVEQMKLQREELDKLVIEHRITNRRLEEVQRHGLALTTTS